MRDAAAPVATPKREKKRMALPGKRAKAAQAELPPERQARLEQALRAWRLTEAKRRNMPAFRIFGDRTLRNIASSFPRSDSALLAVPGIGMGTVENTAPRFTIWSPPLKLCPRNGTVHSRLHSYDKKGGSGAVVSHSSKSRLEWGTQHLLFFLSGSLQKSLPFPFVIPQPQLGSAFKPRFWA